MPLSTAERADVKLQREELRTLLQSPLFLRSPTLSRLLEYLCERVFAGQTDCIKEYTIALDVFGRAESFDQDADSIVRVEVNRLRKRLAEYYTGAGAAHRLRISIAIGQYVPAFEQVSQASQPTGPSAPLPKAEPEGKLSFGQTRAWFIGFAIILLAITGMLVYRLHERQARPPAAGVTAPQFSATQAQPSVPESAGDETRILAGSSHSYLDHSGKLWSPDSYFAGGSAVRSNVQRIWRTQDASIYRTSRQGEFTYNIPLKRRTYELRLHFAETYYGPEEPGGGGEGSRIMSVSANGKRLLSEFDVAADSGASRTADVKVFTGITPADDGQLHLKFSSAAGAPAMLSAIELTPGAGEHVRPVRIVARDLPYYSNDSQWWRADTYFKGGQFGGSLQSAAGTNDPELYETERWGHFSYAIPIVPGKYTLVLHFIEHRLVPQGVSASDTAEPSSAIEPRTFDVFCNGQRIVSRLNIFNEVGANRPLTRVIKDLEPNAQGKLLLEFVPVSHYATISAIEVLPQ